MKKILFGTLIIACSTAGTAQAEVGRGLYLLPSYGIWSVKSGGYAPGAIPAESESQKGVSNSLELGWQFNTYSAIEVGYTALYDATYTATGPLYTYPNPGFDSTLPTDPVTNPATLSMTPVRTYAAHGHAINVAAVGLLPIPISAIDTPICIVGRVGLAGTTISYYGQPPVQGVVDIPAGTHSVKPTYGLGIQLGERVLARLMVNRLSAGTNASINNMTFIFGFKF